MGKLDNLLNNNKRWAERVRHARPDFFLELSLQQKPEILWIGCSDSRVPANEIVDKLPGEIFVHRNIANVVVHTDLNCLSVIQYAVEVLRVKHIVVCGHYACGGVKAALEAREHGLIDNWLRHIRDVYRFHREELDALGNMEARYDRLCELNIIEQVSNVCHTTIVQNAWAAGQELCVHGWVYRIEDGILRDLQVSASGKDDISDIHRLR
ncbi:MAG TPA: carbonate dehydratase [Bacteroidales bacterium]|nr:carbonate dehydratase [Bacteroidales bacterium]HRZ76094.1 carbonate dehydratase [Bacteroidales bacterium]